MTPYCSHPECHDTRCAYYRLDKYWTAATHSPVWGGWTNVVISFWPFLGAKPLCLIHARQVNGISFGGAP